ncbi:hypothetical protein ACIBW9_00955 [Streptomyces sp. NPDC049541]|uniref:hypothetical protein n=1 Tax=Streptomyces sp. NPDC049541 TaxID=3365594 RepID=UPI0037A36EBD
MASFVRDDPECRSDVVSVGNVHLRSYTESVASFPQPHATALLNIDVLTSTSYKEVTFKDVTLTLEIVSPDGAQFVGYSERPNYIWGVPSGASWDESTPGAPTTRLRVRSPEGVLLSSRPFDGLSYWIAVSGLPDGSPLAFRAAASASRVTATAVSCSLQIKDLHAGDRLTGYLA